MSYGSAPSDLDLEFYARANPDIAAAGVDPATHYQVFGRNEGRAANASQLANGMWSQMTREQSAPAVAQSRQDQLNADGAAYRASGKDPYAFDAEWYKKTYPNLKLDELKADPLQNYLLYGKEMGVSRNALEAVGGLPVDPATGNAPAPASTAPLDPNDPASWAAYKQKAHDATAGINRLPYVAPQTDTLSADPLAVQRQFYPKGNAYGYQQLGSGSTMPVTASGSAMNLGMGSIPPEMMQALMAQGFKG